MVSFLLCTGLCVKRRQDLHLKRCWGLKYINVWYNLRPEPSLHTKWRKLCVLSFVEILCCCSTLLPPPLNNRFGLIGQLLVPPLSPHYAAPPAPLAILPPHLPSQKKPVVFNLFLTQLQLLERSSKKKADLIWPLFSLSVELDIFPEHVNDSNENNRTVCSVFIHWSACLTIFPFLFCYVVNTGNHIPEIHPALDQPATTVCNVITYTHTQQFSHQKNKIKV